MPIYKSRKLEVYSLHVRNGDEEVAYGQLFTELAAMAPIERQNQFATRLVAVPRLEFDGRRVTIHAYEGDVNVNPLIFHSVLVEERTQSLEQHEVLVHKTHALLDLTTRDCIVEYNQRGAKASDIALLLEMLARRLPRYPNATVDMNPVANDDFEVELNRFNRIQLAGLKVARPNADWTDCYSKLTEIAAESNGRLVNLEIVAARNT